jgi:hypothetical protein
MELTLKEAEAWVSQANNAQWEGWNLALYTKDPNAFMRPTGAFWQGQWALKSVVQPNQDGRYVIGKRFTNNARRPWH